MELTPEQKIFLIAALPAGEFYLISVHGRTWIQIGNADFPDDPEFCDLAKIATYREAFESLCDIAYIVHETGFLYRLTDSGFKIARKLAEEEQ